MGMIDMERTITKLKILRTWCAVDLDHGKGLCVKDCCAAVGWLDDALELLKLQEPADVVERPREFVCPKCGLRLAGRSTDDCVLLETDETPNFCWRCGQAVRWE